MDKLITTTLLFLMSGIIICLNGQSITDVYEDNVNIALAKSFEVKGDKVNQRLHFIKATQDFEKSDSWLNYINALTDFVYTFKGEKIPYETELDLEQRIGKINHDDSSFLEFLHHYYYGKGFVYCYAVENKKAIKAFKNSYHILKKKYPKEASPYFSSVYSGLGIVYRDGINLDSSLYYFNNALDVILKYPDHSNYHTELAKTYEHLGYHYSLVNNYEKAIELTGLGLKHSIIDNGEEFIENVWFYRNLASFYSNLEEFDLSIDFLNKSVHILINSNTDDIYLNNEMFPDLYHSLSYCYLSQGKNKKAKTYLDKAFKIIKDAPNNEGALYGHFINYSEYFQRANDYEKELVYLLKCDSLLTHYPKYLKDLRNNYNSSIAGLKSRIASNYLAQKKFDQTITQLNILNDFIRDDDYLIRNYAEHTAGLIASSYIAQNNYAKALVHNEEAFLINCESCNSFEDIYSKDVSFYNDAGAFILLSQRLEINQNLLNHSGIDQSQESLKLVQLGAKLHLSSLKKMSALRGNNSQNLIQNISTFYNKGVELAFNHYLKLKDEKSKSIVFEYIQKLKAQKLSLDNSARRALSSTSVPVNILEKEKELQSEIIYYEKLLSTAMQKKDSAQVDNISNKFLLHRKIAYNDLVLSIEKNHPEYFEEKYTLHYSSLNEISDVLESNELLIEYLIQDESLLIFTINQQGRNIIQVPFNSKNEILEYNNLIQKYSLNRNKNKSKFIKLSHHLYNQFISPIKEELSNKNKLIIIGDNIIHYIPFESLIETNDKKEFSNLPYLINDYEVSYHYSSSLFYKTRKKEIEYNNNMVVFAPVYDNNSNKNQNLINSAEDLRAINQDGTVTFLPESEREVNQIRAELMKDNKKEVDLFKRESANKDKLKEILNKDYQYVHIAGHSFADLKNPSFSGIICYQNENNEDDNILYLAEINQSVINSDLVTLSSCESGLGKLDSTDGLLGLNRAFIQSGVNNVVFSLWKVVDKPSADLMIDFYKNISQSQSYSEALRNAKLKMIKTEETASPNYWSAFLLIGR